MTQGWLLCHLDDKHYDLSNSTVCNNLMTQGRLLCHLDDKHYALWSSTVCTNLMTQGWLLYHLDNKDYVLSNSTVCSEPLILMIGSHLIVIHTIKEQKNAPLWFRFLYWKMTFKVIKCHLDCLRVLVENKPWGYQGDQGMTLTVIILSSLQIKE